MYKYLLSFILGYIMYDFGAFTLLGLIAQFCFYALICSEEKLYKNLIYVGLSSFGFAHYIQPVLELFFKIYNPGTSWGISILIGLIIYLQNYFLVILKYLMFDRKELKIPIKEKVLIFSIMIFIIFFMIDYPFVLRLSYYLPGIIEYLSLLRFFGTYIYEFFFVWGSFVFLLESKKKAGIIFGILFVLNLAGFLVKNDNYELNKKLSISSYQGIELPKNLPVQSDLLLFPENFIKYLMVPDINYKEDPVIQQLTDNRQPFIVGGAKVEEDNKVYNSLMYFKDNKFEFYYKNKPFPLGETISPLNAFLPGQNRVGLSVKNEYNIFKYNDWNILPLICFEVYSSNVINRFYKEHDKLSFISVNSNEMWLVSENLRSNMNNYLKILAKEYNTYIVKTDKRGPNIIINNTGSEISKFKDTSGFLHANIPLKKSENWDLYAQHGVWMITFLIGIVALINSLQYVILLFKSKHS